MKIRDNGVTLRIARKNIREARSTERLASGMCINSASDDPSGLAISEKMKAQIRGLSAADSNVQDGISLIQTADGALTEVHEVLQRVRELAEKAANGILGEDERNALQAETDQLLKEIDRISQSTTFNEIPLLNGFCAGSPPIPGENAIYRAEIDFDAAQDGSNILIDGVNFEFDSNHSLSDPTAVSVDISAATDGSGRAAAFKAALEGSSIAQKVNISFEGGPTKWSMKLEEKEPSAKEAMDVKYKTVMDVKTGEKEIDPPANTRSYTLTDIQPETIRNGTTFVAANVIFEFYDKEPAELQAPKPPFTTVVGVKIEPSISSTLVSFANAFNSALSQSNTDFLRDASVLDLGTTPETWLIQIIDIIFNNPPIDNDLPIEIVDIGFNMENTVTNKLDGKNVERVPGTEDIPKKNGLMLQVGASNDEKMEVVIPKIDIRELGLSDLSLKQIETAGKAMGQVDNAIGIVSQSRSGLGAAQNRLEHTANNLRQSEENISTANSRIRDTNMAKEMSNKTRETVLMQSTQAMLAQANTHMGDVLQLIQ